MPQTTKNTLSELEKREKRAMERKISELEEELKVNAHPEFLISYSMLRLIEPQCNFLSVVLADILEFLTP